MIETLLKRRTIREFLKSYSEEQWKDLIPAVFEIGVLSLEKSFNKILFTKDELKDIIEDLINSDYHRSKQPKKIEKLQNPNQPQTQPPIAKPVPSTDKQQPTSKNQLYPLWWGNEQQQEIQNQIAYQEQLNADQVRSNYQYNNPRTFEVNNNQYQQRPFTAGKPQQQQQQQLNRKYRSNEYIPQNEMYTESEESYSNNQRYDINRSNSGKLVMNKLTKESNMNSYIPKNKVNYKISYDKDLRPQSIEKKSKEQKRSSINNNNINNTNINEFRTTSSKDKMQTSNSFRKDDMKDSDSRYDMNKRNKEECYYMDYPGENVENVQQQQQLHVVQKEGMRNYSHKPSKQVSRQSSQKHSMLQQSPSDNNNDTQELQHNNNNDDENLFVESGGEQIDNNNNQQQMQYEQIVNDNKEMMDSNYSNGDGNINNNEINVYQEEQQQQQNVQYKYKNPQNVPTTQIKNEGITNNNSNNHNIPPIQQNDVNDNMNIEINHNDNNTNKYTQQKQLSANKQSEMNNNNNNNNWNNQPPSSHIQIQQRHTQVTNNNNNNYQQQNPNRNKYNNIQQYEYHHHQQMNMNNNNYNLPNEYNHIHHYDNNRIYNLQTSNYSNNQYNPTEQLSMIEVSDELKSK